MYKVVFDTNIFISALHFKTGPPRIILNKAITGSFHLFISKSIIAEFRGVLKTKFAYSDKGLGLVEDLLNESFELVEPKKKLSVIVNDPDDNRILEAAVAAQAEVIVSGDKHLLSLNKYKSVLIISAKEFLEKYLKEN